MCLTMLICVTSFHLMEQPFPEAEASSVTRLTSHSIRKNALS
jgi:hypothetical protein